MWGASVDPSPTGVRRAPADGAEVELVFGSQGGFHLPLAVDAIGLDTSELVVGNFVGLVDGVEVARGEPWLDFRCNPVTATQQSWNILLFFEIDANREDFFGRDIDVSGSLRDAMGREVLLEATMTIADGSN